VLRRLIASVELQQGATRLLYSLIAQTILVAILLSIGGFIVKWLLVHPKGQVKACVPTCIYFCREGTNPLQLFDFGGVFDNGKNKHKFFFQAQNIDFNQKQF
jgi:hypothetical protein